MIKKIVILISITTIIFAKTCIVIYIVKKSNPSYNHLYYKETFPCENAKQGWLFQKRLGCRKRSFLTKNWKKQFLYICPILVSDTLKI